MAGKEKYTPTVHKSDIPTVQRQSSSGVTFDDEQRKSASGDLQIRIASEVVAAVGQPTTLECQVLPWMSQERHGQVTWLHDGSACEGPRYLHLQQDDRRYLFIKDTVVEDGGGYVVVARDEEATVQETVNVRIAQPVLEKGDRATAVEAKDFPAYMKKKCTSPENIYKEFSRVELEWDVTQHSSNMNCNMHKNRYINVFPYDHSRVVLSLRDNVPGSDYINASHIVDSVSGSRYIASQGPLSHTYGDFWRMVWEQDVHVIAMVTKSSHHFGYKEQSYWPEGVGEGVEFDGHVMTLTAFKETRHWIRRDITVLNKETSGEGAESRDVVHYQFLSWPEYGVPKRPTDLLAFRQMVVDSHKDGTPLLVHCSAGVGRTGTFICVDILLKRLPLTEQVDVFSLVRELRFTRECTVETPEQYILVHEAVAEVISPK